MEDLTKNLTLSPNTPIDLQLHTINSDGAWTPEALIDHLVSEGFGLVAITDHDRVDTIASVQELGAQKRLPILTAVEMTTNWRGEMTDVLCFGFDPLNNELNTLALDVARRQRENTTSVYNHLIEKGYLQTDESGLSAVLEKPSAQQPHGLIDFITKSGFNMDDPSARQALKESGIKFETTEIASVVDAAHRSGAVCLIAHPGRSDGFPTFDENLLDQLREEVPIDGFEVYYPKHSPEQTAMFLAYAQKHNLLYSAGSDSHDSEKQPPIKYNPTQARPLLERLGIKIE